MPGWLFAQINKDNPLNNLIIIEAENCLDSVAFITPVSGPYRMYKNLAEPAIATTEIEVPETGQWYIHVSYFVTPENIRKLLSSPKPRAISGCLPLLKLSLVTDSLFVD